VSGWWVSSFCPPWSDSWAVDVVWAAGGIRLAGVCQNELLNGRHTTVSAVASVCRHENDTSVAALIRTYRIPTILGNIIPRPGVFGSADEFDFFGCVRGLLMPCDLDHNIAEYCSCITCFLCISPSSFQRFAS